MHRASGAPSGRGSGSRDAAGGPRDRGLVYLAIFDRFHPDSWQPWEGSILPAWRADLGQFGEVEGRTLAAILSVESGGRAQVTLRAEDGAGVLGVVFSARQRGLKNPQAAKAWGEQTLRGWLTGKVGSGVMEALASIPENVPVDGLSLSTIHDIHYLMLFIST